MNHIAPARYVPLRGSRSSRGGNRRIAGCRRKKNNIRREAKKRRRKPRSRSLIHSRTSRQLRNSLVSRGWIDRGWARIDDRRDEACRFKSACERASEERSSRPDPEIDPTSSFYRSITSIPRHNRSWSGTCTSRTRRWLLISTWVPW